MPAVRAVEPARVDLLDQGAPWYNLVAGLRLRGGLHSGALLEEPGDREQHEGPRLRSGRHRVVGTRARRECPDGERHLTVEPRLDVRRVRLLAVRALGHEPAGGDDPDAVRELLGRYFDICREIIERYGGTVEKFRKVTKM